MRDAGSIGRAQMRIGSVLDGKWRLDTLLGVGGSAAVYAATHRNTKRAAIKILHPELSTHSELVARFIREGYVANKIGHPGTVTILDDDRAEDGSVYLVMELLDGFSLDRCTRPNDAVLELREILRVVDDLLDVLAAAHDQGIIHRDIKPANLFLTSDKKLKVLDFGIARLAEPLADGSATQTGMTIGTPSFMPPEQARGRWQHIDARTDLWAVGATMFALVTQRKPRMAETPNEELLLAMTTPVEPVAQIVAGLPPEIAHIIDKAVALEMDARWQSARVMRDALREAVRAVEARGADLSLQSRPTSSSFAPVPNTIQIGEPSSAPLLPRPRVASVAPATAALHVGDPLTTGRAFLNSQLPPQPPGRGALVAGLLVGVVAVVFLGFAASHYFGSQSAVSAGSTPAAAPVDSAGAQATSAAPTEPSDPSIPTAAPPAIPQAGAPPTSSATAPPTALAAAPPTSTTPAAAPPSTGGGRTAAPARPVTTANPPAARKAAPGAPPSAKPGDPFDQRF